jgi:1,4-dihydroxy-2-naphthoate octaprenyltransferase
MTSAAQWWEGARPRTLGLAVAPVAVGTAAGALDGGLRVERAALAALVAIALQIGVNYANDYSDGVRGTDAERRGPLRLTASGLAAPAAVRRAAWISFGVGALAGGVLSLLVDRRLLLLGVVAIAAAWGYTGGRRPYGYSGFGEVAVLAFFGFAACAGSAYVQHRHVPAAGWWGSLVIGLPACAVLLVNNIRDIPGDEVAGKRTLAVRIGAPAARRLFVACLGLGILAIVPIASDHPAAAIAFAGGIFAAGPVRIVLTQTAPPRLVAALVGTVRFAVATAGLLTLGLAVS